MKSYEGMAQAFRWGLYVMRAIVVNRKIMQIIKRSCKMETKHFEIPHYA